MFLVVLNFVWPVVLVIAIVWGFFTLRRMTREIRSIRASRGDATAMELEMFRLKARLFGIAAVLAGITVFGAGVYLTQNEYENKYGIYGSAAVGVVCFLVLFVKSADFKRRYNDGFKENFVAAELSKVFGNLQYKPGERFSNDEITGLGLFEHIDRIGGSDLIHADYKGVSFRQSDLTVQEVWTETETDDDGHTRTVERSRDVFKGRVMKFDFAAAFRGEVRVISRDFSGARAPGSGWQSVETELAEFGEHFNVLSPDPVAAMTVLTPQMIEGIYYLERTVNMPVAFHFTDNSMFAFLATGRDAFEASGKTLLEARTQLTRDISLVTGFMETMYFGRQESAGAGGGAPNEPLRRRNISGLPPMPVPGSVENLTRKGKQAGNLVSGNLGRFIFALYAVSAVYTLIKLPGGIVLSTDITSETAQTAPTLVYLAVLTVFMLPFLSRRMLLTWRARLSFAPYGGLLLLFHYLFVSANIGG